ncbi:BolA family transcriptional regulator [Gammaproteobacteria bacterium AH-315-C21]|nr:BolA family transcriptional regulator [Gammaproteobacteria bacterium AH-315-C21]
MSDRITMIRQRLTEGLSPSSLEITDDSHKHIGHAGAASGGGHFTVHIVSEVFAGKSLVQRHRAIYDALGDAMESEIHALSIKAKTLSEISA